MKWEIEGKKILAWIDDERYYCTNESGNGLFFVDETMNNRKQLLGTMQFSVNGVKDKKAKMRKVLNEIRRRVYF